MLKRILTIFMSLCILSSYVYADALYDTTDNNVKEYKLSLDDAINIALENNPQINVCEIKKQDYKTQLSAAKINHLNSQKNRTIYVTSGYEAKYVIDGYYVKSYEDAYKLCDYEMKKIIASISYDVTQKYYNLKNCEKLAELANKSHSLMLENYNNIKLSYDNGLVSKSDINNAEINLKRTEYALITYKNNLDMAKESFKISIRKNYENCNFVLTDKITYEEYTANFNDDIVLAESSRYDILGLKSNYELAKMYFELTTLPVNTAKYTSAKSNFISAEYNYKNNKDLILLGVRSAYNNITTTKNNLEIAEMNLKQKQDDYNIAKIKFEQGLITGTDLSSALNDLSQAEIETENSKLEYKLALSKYKYEIEIGL